MALVLTLLSIALAYFSPADLIPALAPYHIQQVILAPAALLTVAVYQMRRAGLQAPQYILMIGFWFAVVMSMLARHWLRASLSAFLDFGLVVCVYFLVAINAHSLSRISIFCRVIALCGLVMAVQGILAYHTGYRGEDLLNQRMIDGVATDVRITGLGVLHDPNDFAQFLLIAVAFLGAGWRRGRLVRNFAVVGIPAAVLVYAIFLTFSRGAIFGLAALAFVAVSSRASRFKAVLVSGIFFAVLVVAQFTATREISFHAGAATGRINAWGSGISQLRTDPLFGVGYGQFTEYNDLTAHNSFVLCFAETGFFGYFFWLALLLTTALGLEALAGLPRKTPEDADFLRCVNTVRGALFACLSTSWFLSRTYHETLYIILALGAALIYMRRTDVPAAVLPMIRWVPVTFCVQIASIAVLYLTIRLHSL